MTQSFGSYIRERRLALLERDRAYSLRRVAQAIDVEPSFLSKVERSIVPPPSEAKIKCLAKELGEDSDVLLAPWRGKFRPTCRTLFANAPAYLPT